MNTIRLGIIGCGEIGQKHLKVATESPSIEVVAVADVREQVALDAARRFKVPKAYTSATQLLSDPKIDGVVFALPTAGRADIAKLALREGKHVLLEKPIAMNCGEVRELIAARGDRVVACCSARFRMLAPARAATKLIAEGALGDLRVLHVRQMIAADERPTSPPPPWRLSKSLNGGGILMNWGCYSLDYLFGVTGWKLKPVQVLAQCWPVAPVFASHAAPGSDAEAHAVALVRCERGAVLTLECGDTVALQGEDSWRIVGTCGSLRMRMTQDNNEKVFLDQADEAKGVITKVVWEGEEDFWMRHAGVVRDFADAIRVRRSPATSLENALVVQQVCDAIYESAERGTMVAIG